MIALDVLQILVFPGLFFLFVLAFFYEWIDRKTFAKIQNRRGPSKAGPGGILQPIADFLKLLSKEDIVPAVCDKLLFTITPILYLALPLTALFVMPIASSTGLAAFEGDLVFVMFIFALLIITVFLGGWSSMNRYGMMGGSRAILQMMSFELPMALALSGPAIAAKSLSISTISQWQSGELWLILLQPIGFAVLLICLMAELEASPFNIPESESEVVAGWRTEFSGRRLAMIRLGKDLELVLAAALISALYLGGISDFYFIPAIVIFLIKTIVVVLVISFLRAIFARLRLDQSISGMWKYLLPLAILQIILIELGIGI
ncbi:MAG TPA: complex I subunit 1 family protein [Candidatus Acidoferrales bacterium]|nr:complex I subunit 1 family protein [Candidatus Acidoferrales bacterium]